MPTATVTITVLPEAGCQELGRVTRAYVSGYDRARIHVGTVRRRERRCVVANFNGALPAGRTIQSVTWHCNSPWLMVMSAAAVEGRQAQVLVDFQHSGIGALRATVTLDNGEIYNQAFEFTIRDAPWFVDQPVASQGPWSVTVEAG